MGNTTTRLWNLASLPTLAAVEAWLARQPSSSGVTWCAFADPDGAVGLVPSGPGGQACPAVLLVERPEGYDVTVCDPDDPVELGVFATIEDALQGIGRWMAWVRPYDSLRDHSSRAR